MRFFIRIACLCLITISTYAQNVGIGTTNPLSKFSVGPGSQFQVDTLGDVKRINNVTTNFPATQGSKGTVLLNRGFGSLTWQGGVVPSGAMLQTEYYDSSIIRLGYTLVGTLTQGIQNKTDSFAWQWSNLISDAGAPSARIKHSAVWTGTEMIIWGGWNGSSNLNSGGRYNLLTNSWGPPLATTAAPSARKKHSAVWTGTEMIIWGGDSGVSVTAPKNDGLKYNPATNTWGPPLSAVNAPSSRHYHTAVWTGTHMIIWGGDNGTILLNSGRRYYPLANTWDTLVTTTNAPTARVAHSAIWTGTEMIIWGGINASGTNLNSGGRFNPVSNSWGSPLSLSGAPLGRTDHSAVWTGTEMIVWGGFNLSTMVTNVAYRYNPQVNAWATLTTQNAAPSTRDAHTAVWAGSDMIVWGGNSGLITNSGIRLMNYPVLGTPVNTTYYLYRKN